MKFDRIIRHIKENRDSRTQNQGYLRKVYPDQNWDFMTKEVQAYEEAIQLLEKHNV